MKNGIPSMLNRKQTRHFILEKWKKLRPGHEINRVSEETFDGLDAKLRAWLIAFIKVHPSKGKTFKL